MKALAHSPPPAGITGNNARAVIIDQIAMNGDNESAELWLTWRNKIKQGVINNPILTLEIENPIFNETDPSNKNLFYPALDACVMARNSFLMVGSQKAIEITGGAFTGNPVVIPAPAVGATILSIAVNGYCYKQIITATTPVANRTLSGNLIDLPWLTDGMKIQIGARSNGHIEKFIYSVQSAVTSANIIDNAGATVTIDVKQMVYHDGQIMPTNQLPLAITISGVNYYDAGMFVVIGFPFTAKIETLPVGAFDDSI